MLSRVSQGIVEIVISLIMTLWDYGSMMTNVRKSLSTALLAHQVLALDKYRHCAMAWDMMESTPPLTRMGMLTMQTILLSTVIGCYDNADCSGCCEISVVTLSWCLVLLSMSGDSHNWECLLNGKILLSVLTTIQVLTLRQVLPCSQSMTWQHISLLQQLSPIYTGVMITGLQWPLIVTFNDEQ